MNLDAGKTGLLREPRVACKARDHVVDHVGRYRAGVELRAARRGDSRPAAECIELRVVFEHAAAGACHRAAIDHHVAGDQQSGAAVSPCVVQAHQSVGRAVIGVGHVFFHRGLRNATGNGRTIGEDQRLEHVHGNTSSERVATLRFKLTLTSTVFFCRPAYTHGILRCCLTLRCVSSTSSGRDRPVSRCRRNKRRTTWQPVPRETCGSWSRASGTCCLA